MPKGVYAVASAMVQEQRLLDGVSENLANAQSAGFKRVQPLRQGFASILAERGRTGDIAGTGGAGITRDGVYRDFSTGEQQNTGNPFDVALNGEGVFYRVRDESGRLLLTRNARFTTDERQRLVTVEGWAVEGQGGPVTLPTGSQSVNVDSSGRITAEVDGGFQFVDQLRVSRVAEADLPRLQAVSGQYFEPGVVELPDAVDYQIQQGFLEGANVQPVEELVRMVGLQRRYDAAQRAMTRQLGMQGFSDVLRGVS